MSRRRVRGDEPALVALDEMFPPEEIGEVARETGFVGRERAIRPVAFFWVLVLGYTTQVLRSLAGLRRRYDARAGTDLSDGSWYPRFTPEAVAFLRETFARAMRRLADAPRRRLGPALARFEDVLIRDGSVIRLPAALATLWPATRSRKIAAGIKVNLLVSATGTGPDQVAVVGERTSESKLLKIGAWVRDRILLFDLGYFKYHAFVRIGEQGGFYVSRLKSNANPLIVAAEPVRGRSVDVVGKRLRDALPRLDRGVLDATVEVEFKRRGHNGRQRKDTHQFRLVAVMNEETGEYHVYLTNIPRETLGAKDIARLYAVRWHVELVFKELKSRHAMDKIGTANPQAVEALVWAALLNLLASRRIYLLVLADAAAKDRPRYTSLRWSSTWIETAPDLLTSVLAYNGIESSIFLKNRVYASQALDPHVNRKRLFDGWLE